MPDEDDPEREVMTNLPRTRPVRRSAKRGQPAPDGAATAGNDAAATTTSTAKKAKAGASATAKATATAKKSKAAKPKAVAKTSGKAGAAKSKAATTKADAKPSGKAGAAKSKGKSKAKAASNGTSPREPRTSPRPRPATAEVRSAATAGQASPGAPVAEASGAAAAAKAPRPEPVAEARSGAAAAKAPPPEPVAEAPRAEPPRVTHTDEPPFAPKRTVPAAGYAAPSSDADEHDSAVADLVSTTLQAAHELAQIGLDVGRAAVRSMLDRLPKS